MSSSRDSTSRPLVGSSRISSFASWLNATASMSFICMPRDRSLIFLFRPSPNCLRYASNRLWSHSGYIGLLVRSTASTVMYSMK